MTPTQLELTRLIGKKELVDIEGCQAFGSSCGIKDSDGKYVCKYCRYWNGQQREEEKCIPATLTDFHRWLVDKCLIFEQRALSFVVKDVEMNLLLEVSYLSSKPLLDQEEATLSAILNLVKSHD